MTKSNKLSIAKLFFLHLITFGVYRFFWLEKNHSDFDKDIRKQENLTIGLFLGGFIQTIFIQNQFESIKKTARENGILVKWSASGLAYLVATITVILVIPAFFHEAFFIIILIIITNIVSLLPIITVQDTLNEVWEKKYPKRIMSNKFTVLESVLSVVGLVVWVWLLLRIWG